MLPTELEELVQNVIMYKCERQNIKLKKASLGTPEKLYDTLSSFSNQTGGGIILFGIDEKNGFEITGGYDSQDLQTKVTNQALQMEPVVRPVFTVTGHYRTGQVHACWDHDAGRISTGIFSAA